MRLKKRKISKSLQDAVRSRAFYSNKVDLLSMTQWGPEEIRHFLLEYGLISLIRSRKNL